jgi:hypothetical protein
MKISYAIELSQAAAAGKARRSLMELCAARHQGVVSEMI